MLAAKTCKLSALLKPHTRGYAAPAGAGKKKIFVPKELRLPKFQGAELKEVQSILAEANADPKRRKALRNLVDIAMKRYAVRLRFWQTARPFHGMPVPSNPLRKAAFAAVLISAHQPKSYDELIYALRVYQEKLQQDAAFLKANADLTNQDKAVRAKAQATVTAFIKGIQTKAGSAKRAVMLVVSKGHYQAIQSGELVSLALEYVNIAKREYKINLTTAHKLSPSEVENWKNRFIQTANDPMATIILSTSEDPTIMGGEVVTVNGTVYDKSWKTQQENIMKRIITTNNVAL